MTGLEIHRLAGVGSPNGIRLALARLSDQGVVRAEMRARAVFYEANRDHLAWPAIDVLVAIRSTLIECLRTAVAEWKLQPLHASVFGSAARGDGDADSDIDILIVRPDGIGEDEEPWATQLDLLRNQVSGWTGNHCQVFQVDSSRLAEYLSVGDPMIDSWQRDGIELAGPALSVYLRTLPRRDHDR